MCTRPSTGVFASTGCPRSDLPITFLLRREELVFPGFQFHACSAASCRLLRELSDPPTICIHVFVKSFSRWRELFCAVKELGLSLVMTGNAELGGSVLCAKHLDHCTTSVLIFK